MGHKFLLEVPSGGTTRTGGKWWPRKILRTQGYTPFNIIADNNRDYLGTVWINNATLVGSGGSSLTINAASSYLRLYP